jgi:hypothetical protein
MTTDELLDIADEVNVKLLGITPPDAIRVLTASMVMVIKAYGIEWHHEEIINLVSSLLREGLKDE